MNNILIIQKIVINLYSHLDIKWGESGPIAQFGRALEWHSRGQEFDPPWVHR